ncbi:uncharacterized protein BcabD6B2_45800 [Babesia caballi]|uniref:Uncharacterized protein n=1 Tax=Babesia caballi TaxID=5871 RepID=A0AAV4LZS0_BABCB|nr:hypothetical protein, conserved [Babesia caballi]
MTDKLGETEGLLREPTNLKEAMDWILRVADNDSNFEGLGKVNVYELTDALKTVLEMDICKICIDEKWRPTFETIRDTFKEQLGDRFGPNSSPIAKFFNGIAYLIGYEKGDGKLTGNGIGKKVVNGADNYVSAYTKGDSWKSLRDAVNDDKKKIAKLFFKAVAIIYPRLVYLYLRCKNENDWGTDKFTAGSCTELSQFLVKEGYDLKRINATDKNGYRNNNGAVFASRINQAFSEFECVYNCSADYFAFLYALPCDDSTECLENLREITLGRFYDKSWRCADCPFATLFIISYAYLLATDPTSVSEIIRNTIGGIAGVAGVGTAAYVSYMYGLIPPITALFA